MKLIYAAKHNNLNDIIYYLNNNTDVNFRSKEGDTALSWAVFYGNFDTVKYLIKCGANINNICNHGDTVLISAVQGEFLSIIKYVCNLNNKLINHVNIEGYTALSYTCNIKTLKYLINKKAYIKYAKKIIYIINIILKRIKFT